MSSADSALYDVVLKPPAILQETGENHVFVEKGVLRPGTKETRSFVLPQLDGMTALLLGDEVTWSFRSPGGDTIVPGETANHAGYEYAAAQIGRGIASAIVIIGGTGLIAP